MMLRRLIYAWRKRRFCKANRFYCPDCIYHDFVWEGIMFRGTRCRYPMDKDGDGDVQEAVQSEQNP